MLYKAKFAIYSETHAKHINTVCGQNVEFWNIDTGIIYSNR